jgi:hypothetical protein
MGKRAKKSHGSERTARGAPKRADLSYLARGLLQDMAKYPDRIEYNTRPLGGAFTDDDLPILDSAYAELYHAGLVEPANATISFFGKPKSLYRLTEKGLAKVKGHAA